jgi:hypothetical protein
MENLGMILNFLMDHKLFLLMELNIKAMINGITFLMKNIIGEEHLIILKTNIVKYKFLMELIQLI